LVPGHESISRFIPIRRIWDYWEEQPAGMIYINYTDAETVQKILAAGMREEKDEGFLDDVPVGN
jgi:hypothetical protein